MELKTNSIKDSENQGKEKSTLGAPLPRAASKLSVSASLRDRLIRRFHGLTQILLKVLKLASSKVLKLASSKVLKLISFMLFVVKKISSFFRFYMSFFSRKRFTSFFFKPLVPSPKNLIPKFILHPLSFLLPHAEPQSRREGNKNPLNQRNQRINLFGALHKISKPSLRLCASVRENKYPVFSAQYSVRNTACEPSLPEKNCFSVLYKTFKKSLRLCGSARDNKYPVFSAQYSVRNTACEPSLPGNRLTSYVSRFTSYVSKSLVPFNKCSVPSFQYSVRRNPINQRNQWKKLFGILYKISKQTQRLSASARDKFFGVLHSLLPNAYSLVPLDKSSVKENPHRNEVLPGQNLSAFASLRDTLFGVLSIPNKCKLVLISGFLFTFSLSAQDSFVIDNSMVYESEVDNSAGETVDTHKAYKVKVSHSIPQTSNEFFSVESETINFVKGFANISGENPRIETLFTYTGLIFNGFTPANLTVSGAPAGNVINVTASYSDSQNFVIDNTYTFDPPAEGEDPPTAPSGSFTIDNSFDNRKIYDVEVAHSLPLTKENFFSFEEESINFVAGRADITGDVNRSVNLLSYPDLTLIGFDPANLTPAGSPELNKLLVTANYKDVQLYNVDGEFTFDVPGEGESTPTPGGAFEVANGFSFSSFRIYNVEVDHTLPGVTDDFFALETEVVDFENGRANINGNQLRTESLSVFPDLTLTGFNPATLPLSGTPDLNKFLVSVGYNDIQTYNVGTGFTFDPTPEGEDPPEGTPISNAVNTFAFDSFKIYNVKVLHNLPETYDNFLMLETDSVVFENGRANITGAVEVVETLKTYPDLTYLGFSPVNLTPTGSPENNNFDVTALYKDVQAYNISNTYVFDPPVEGEDPPENQDFAEAITSSSFSNYRVYKAEITHNLPGTKDSFMILELENAAFTQGLATITGDYPRTISLLTYPQYEFKEFSPQALTAIGAPELNILSISARYSTSDSTNFDNSYVFNPPVEGEDPINTADPLISDGSFDSHRIYKVDVLHNLTAVTDSFFGNETESVNFVKGFALIDSDVDRSVKLTDYPSLTLESFTPQILQLSGTPQNNNFLVVAAYRDIQTYSFDNTFSFDPPIEGEDPPEVDPNAAVLAGSFNSYKYFQLNYIFEAAQKTDTFMVEENTGVSASGGTLSLAGGFPDGDFSLSYPALTFSPNNFTIQDEASSKHVVDVETTVQTFTINFVAGANGKISGKTSQIIDMGGTAEAVVAVPNPSYAFIGWQEDSDTNPIKIPANIQADATYTAQFEYRTHSVTFTHGNNGSLVGETNQTVGHNLSTTPVTALPDPGYKLTAWSDSSTDLQRVIANVTAPLTFDAQFELNVPFLISHNDNDLLAVSENLFVWSPVEDDTTYTLSFGTSVGAANLTQVTTSETEASVGGLPQDGSLVYVRIQSDTQGTIAYSDYVLKTGAFPYSGNISLIYRGVADMASRMSGNFEGNVTSLLNGMINRSETDASVDEILAYYRDQYAKTPPDFIKGDNGDEEQRPAESFSLSGEFDAVIPNTTNSISIDAIEYRQDDKYAVLARQEIIDNPQNPQRYYGTTGYPINYVIESDMYDVRGLSKDLGKPTVNDYINTGIGIDDWTKGNSSYFTKLNGKLLFSTAYQNPGSYHVGYHYVIQTLYLGSDIYYTMIEGGNVQVNTYTLPMSDYEVVFTEQPKHGTVSSSASHYITYTPNDPGYVGPDSFTYSLNHKSTGTTYKTINYRVKLYEADEEYLYEFTVPGGNAEKWGTIVPDELINEARNDNSRLSLNATATYEYNGNGGTYVHIPETSNSQSPIFDGLNLSFKNGSNMNFAFETRIRFPDNNRCGIVLMETKHKDFDVATITLREDGKLQLNARDFLSAGGFLELVSDNVVPSSGWSNISVNVNLASGSATFKINDTTSGKSGSALSKIPLPASEIKFFTRFVSNGANLPALDIDYLRVITNLGSSYSNRKGEEYTEDENFEIFTDGYNWLNRLQVTPERYNYLQSTNQLALARNDLKNFYNYHPNIYSSYHGMNEFKLAVKDELELPDNTRVTISFKTDENEDWKTLIVTDVSSSAVVNNLRWFIIPWDTNKVQNDWTQELVDTKGEFKKYRFKFEIDHPALTDNTLEVTDYLNGSFKHVFSYDPVVTALEPDKEFSPVQLRFDRNSHEKVLRDYAIFNANDKIIDVVVRKKINATASTLVGLDTDELFGAQKGDSLSDGTEVLYVGNIFYGGFPLVLDAENSQGRYAYKTYTIFTDDPNALTSTDPNVNKSVIEGNEFIYDSFNNREGLEFVRSSLKDNFAPFQPVITANPGDGAVGLSWSYQDRESGRSADIEVENVKIEVSLNGTIVQNLELGNVRNTIVKNLENGKQYSFKVLSYDSYDNVVSGQVNATPVRTAVAVTDVSNFQTFVGLDTVALKWHYKPENQAPVDPVAFLKWKNTSSSLTEGTIGFLIFRQQNGTDKLIAALPVDFSQPDKEYLFIDKGLDSDTNYIYKIFSIDRDNNRTLGQEATVSTISQELLQQLSNIENSQYYSKTTFQSGATSAAGWFGAANGAIPDHHLTASLPQNVTTENINAAEHLVIPAGSGGTQLYQQYIPENGAFSASITAQVSGSNQNNTAVTILSFKNLDDESDSRFENSQNVVRTLTLYEDHIEFNGSWYGFAHGGEIHTYAINRFFDDYQLIIDGHIVEETHKLKTIPSEQGNSFIRFGAASANQQLQVKVSDLTYAVGVPYYFGGQSQNFDVIPPAAPTSLLTDLASAGDVTISWTPPADTDVKAYFVELDNYNGYTAWTRTSSITLTLPDSLLFTGRVTAVDSSGNYSVVSEDVQFTVNPASFGTAEVQDATTAWTGWVGSKINQGSWVHFSNTDTMEKVVSSGSLWSTELNLSLVPGEFEFEDLTTIPVMEDNTILRYLSGSKEWLVQFTADQLKLICKEGQLSTEAAAFDFTAGGFEHSLRLINKENSLYIFMNGRFVGTSEPFTYDSIKVGNIEGPGVNVKSLKVLNGTTAAPEFTDLNTFTHSFSEPEVKIDEANSIRENGNLKLSLLSTTNANAVDIKVLEPEFTGFTKAEANQLFDLKAVPLKWIDNGAEVELGEMIFDAKALPMPYLVSVKPARFDAHRGLGDSHSYQFIYTEGAQLSGLRIDSEDLSGNLWNYKFASNTSQTISYPSFVIPHKTVNMGASETKVSSPGADYYTIPLETTSFDFSSWVLNQGYEGTLIRLVGKDSQGNPRTVPLVYEDGKIWLYNEAIYTTLYTGQINNIRVTWSGSSISIYLNNDPEVALQADVDATFTDAGSTLSFGLVNPIDPEFTSHKLIWAEPKFTRNGQSTPFIENDTISTAWTYIGQNTHIVDENQYFGVTSLRAYSADQGYLFVNKSDVALGDEWTVEFVAGTTKGSSIANFYTNLNKKISFDIPTGMAVYRVVYSNGSYFVTRSGVQHASGVADEDAVSTVSFELEVTSNVPQAPTGRGSLLLREFKVVNNATDSIITTLEPLRGAIYAEETVYKQDGSVDTDKGRMLFQPVYLSTASTGLNWNFEHTSTVQPFTQVAGQTRFTPVTYDYNPGAYGVTISEQGDFTVGLNNVTTTYIPEAGPDLNKPRNLNIDRTPTTVTFSWNAPAGTKPNQYLVQLFDPVNGLLDFDPASLDASLTSDNSSQINVDPQTAPDTISVTYNIPATSQNKELFLQIASQFRKGDQLTSRSEFLTEQVEPYDSNSVSFDPQQKHLEAFPEDRAIRLQVSFPPDDLQGYLLWRSDPDVLNNPQTAYVDKILIKLDDNAIDLIDQLTAGYPGISLPSENILESIPVNSKYFFFHGEESSFNVKVNRVHNSTSENEKTYNFAIDPYDNQQPSDLTKPNLGSTEAGAGEIVSNTTTSNINVVNTTGVAQNQSPKIIDRRAVISLANGTPLTKFSDLSSSEEIAPYIINNLDPDTLLVPSVQYEQEIRISGPAVADRSLTKVSLQIGSETFSSVLREHIDLSEDNLDAGDGFFYNPKDGLIYHNVDTTFTAARYLRQGANTIYLSAEDKDGAKAHAEIGITNFNNEVETATVILDNQAPTFNFIPGRTDDFGRSILTENFTFSGLYNDISGIGAIEVLIDGQAVVLDSSNAKVANGVFTIQLANTVADGEHTVTVILTDLAGNVSQEKSFNVIFTSTHMAASITHSIDVFGNRQFFSEFENVNFTDITKITMNGVELDAAKRQMFYDASEIAPVTFQSMGYTGENDPGNHLVAFRVTVEFDVNGETISRELTAAAEWYNNDDLPTITSTVPSVNEILYSTNNLVTMDQLIINVFDQDPGVEFDKIEIVTDEETGERTDVKNKFNLTNFAASLKEGETLELIPEEWTNGPEGDTKRTFIYLTLKEKETGVIVETKLTYFVFPENYQGPILTSVDKYVIADGKIVELLLKGRNLSELNFVTLKNHLTGETQTFPVDEIYNDGDESEIELTINTFKDGPYFIFLDGKAQPQTPIISLPLKNQEQANAIIALFSDHNNDGEENGFDIFDFDLEEPETSEEIYARAVQAAEDDDTHSFDDDFDINIYDFPEEYEEAKIKILSPVIDPATKLAKLANGYVSIEGIVPNDTYLVEVKTGLGSAEDNTYEVAALTRGSDGKIKFLVKNLFIDNLVDKEPQEVTVTAYINNAPKETLTFKVSADSAPQILGFFEGSPEIYAYKSVYKSLPVGEKLVKRGQIVGLTETENSPQGLDGLIISENPLSIKSLKIYIDNSLIDKRLWEFKSSDSDRQLQLTFRDKNRINIFDIVSQGRKNSFVDPWTLFESVHVMRVSITDIQNRTSVVYRTFTLNRGEHVKYNLSYKNSISGPSGENATVTEQLKNLYSNYAGQIHTYIEQEYVSAKNLGTNGLNFNFLRLDPLDYGFTKQTLEGAGIYSEIFPGYFGSGSFPDEELGKEYIKEFLLSYHYVNSLFVQSYPYTPTELFKLYFGDTPFTGGTNPQNLGQQVLDGVSSPDTSGTVALSFIKGENAYSGGAIEQLADLSKKVPPSKWNIAAEQLQPKLEIKKIKFSHEEVFSGEIYDVYYEAAVTPVQNPGKISKEFLDLINTGEDTFYTGVFDNLGQSSASYAFTIGSNSETSRTKKDGSTTGNNSSGGGPGGAGAGSSTVGGVDSGGVKTVGSGKKVDLSTQTVTLSPRSAFISVGTGTGTSRTFTLDVNDGDKVFPPEEGGNTSANGYLLINDGAGIPSETEDGTAKVEVLFPSISGSSAQSYLKEENTQLYYDMRFNRKYKVFGTGFVVSSGSDRKSLSAENTKPIFLSASTPYSFISIDQSKAYVTYSDYDNSHYLNFEIYVLDPMTAYDLNKDPNGLAKVIVNEHEITHSPANGEGIILTDGKDGQPVYKILVRDLPVRRGINGIFVQSINKFGVKTDTYFSVSLEDLDDLLSTNDDVILNSVSSVYKRNKTDYPSLNTAHIFGEFEGSSGKIDISGSSFSSTLELQKINNRYGRFHREFFVMDADFVDTELSQISTSIDSPIAGAIPGQVVSLSTDKQNIPVYVEGISLKRLSSRLTSIPLDENTYTVHSLNAYINEDRHKGEGIPEFEVMLFSKYGIPQPLFQNETKYTVPSDTNLTKKDWGPTGQKGWTVAANIELIKATSKNRIQENTNGSVKLGIKPGEFLLVTVGGIRKVYQIAPKANVEDYELVTGITPVIDYNIPVKGMGLSAEVISSLGQLKVDHNLLSVSGRKLPLYLGLTYRSNHLGNSHLLGNGWSASWDRYFVRTPGGFTYHAGNGRRDFFGTGSDEKTLIVPAGYFIKAEISNDQNTIKLTTLEDTVSTFSKVGNNDNWKIISIQDRFKNTVSYSYNFAGALVSIQDDLGRFYDFSYTSTPFGIRLSQINDFKDFSFTFSYSDQTGDLTKVSLNGGDTVNYEYNDFNGNTYLSKIHDFAHVNFLDDKVEEITLGEAGNVNESLVNKFSYTGTNSLTYTDSNNLKTTYLTQLISYSITPEDGVVSSINYSDSLKLPTNLSTGTLDKTITYVTSTGSESDTRGNSRVKGIVNTDASVVSKTYHPINRPNYGRVKSEKINLVETTYSYNEIAVGDKIIDETTSSTTSSSNEEVKTVTETNTYGQVSFFDSPLKTVKYSYYISDDKFRKTDDREGYLYSINTINKRSSAVEENAIAVGTSQEDITIYTGRDAYGRLISQTNPKGATTIYGYNSIGELLSTTSPSIYIDRDKDEPEEETEQLLNIFNPEDTRVITNYQYDDRGIKVKEIVSNPVPYYGGTIVEYKQVITDTTYTYDAAYRLIEETTPVTIDIGGTKSDITKRYFYQNNGKGSRIKAVRKPNGYYDVHLLDKAGREQYMVVGSDTHNLKDGDPVPTQAIAFLTVYDSSTNLIESRWQKFQGEEISGANGAGWEKIESFTYEEGTDLVDVHTQENPRRVTDYGYKYNIVNSILEFDGADKKIRDTFRTFYDKDFRLKTEKDNVQDTTKTYTYKVLSNYVKETSTKPGVLETVKETWLGSSGNEVATKIDINHISNKKVGASEITSMSETTVNLFDDHNQLLSTEVLYNSNRPIQAIQDDLKGENQFYKNLYSSTDQVIGKQLPSTVLKDKGNDKVKIFPSAFGPGIQIDQNGKISSVLYNEIGQVLQVGEALNSIGVQPRYTNYAYTIYGYNHYDQQAQMATRSTLVYRKDKTTGKSLGREEVYNHQNKLLAVIDFNNLTNPALRVSDSYKMTTYTYDERLRTKTVTRPNNKNLEYHYYALIPSGGGQLNENSLKLQLVKDPDENLILRSFSDYDIFGNPKVIDEFNYHDTNGDGNWDISTRVTLNREYSDATNSANHEYGKMTSESTTISRNTSTNTAYVDVFSKTIHNSYHQSGPRKTLSFDDGDYVYYTYDGGTISDVRFGQSGQSVTAARHMLTLDFKDAAGRYDLRTPLKYSFNGGEDEISIAYKENERRFGLVESISLKTDGNTYQPMKLTYDNLQQKLSKNYWTNHKQDFVYDEYDRLKESTTNNLGYSGRDNYSLDQFDNFLQGGNNTLFSSQLTVTQGSYNRYTSFTPNGDLKSKTIAPNQILDPANPQQQFIYDAAGNLTQDSNFSYSWDNFQRLSKAEVFRYTTVVPQQAHHAYDAAGRRVHTFYINEDGNIQYAEDPNFLLPVYAIINNDIDKKWNPVFYTYDGSKMIEKSFNSDSYIRRYFYENTNSPFAVENEVFATNEILFLARDTQGSILGAFNDNLYEHYYYNSTGLMHCFSQSGGFEEDGPIDQDFGWAGMFIDPFTGHYHTHYREFDPVTNRWLSEDPAGMVDGMNLYANYFGVNEADPDGRAVFTTLAILTLTAAAGIALDNYFHHPLDGKFNWKASAAKNVAIASSGVLAGHLYKGSCMVAFGIEAAVDLGASTAYDTMIHGEDLGTSLLKNTIFAGIGLSLNLGFAKRVCFVEGTQVKTKDGSKNIEDIKKGDLVWSRDDKTGKVGWKPVVQTFVNKPKELVHLTYRNKERKTHSSQKVKATSSDDDEDSESQTLIGTKEHPFWSVDREKWVKMGDLKSGETLKLTNGQLAVVDSLEIEKAEEGKSFTTYNFEVKDWHTYFVAPKNSPPSTEFVWVHNTCTKEFENYLNKYADDWMDVTDIDRTMIVHKSHHSRAGHQPPYKRIYSERMEVDYDSSMGLFAQKYRRDNLGSNGVYGQQNIAVFEVNYNQRVYWVTMQSLGEDLHSERRFIDIFIRGVNSPQPVLTNKNISRVYSELEPCNFGRNTIGCTSHITDYLEGVPLYYSWLYNSGLGKQGKMKKFEALKARGLLNGWDGR